MLFGKPRFLAGGPGFDFVSRLTAHGGSITSEEVTMKYREGAPCSARTGERGDFSLLHAKETQTLLRQGRSAFHYLQLLPADCVAGNSASAKHICPGAPRSTQEIRVCSRWLCG